MRDHEFRDILERTADDAPTYDDAVAHAIADGTRHRRSRDLGRVALGGVAAACAAALVVVAHPWHPAGSGMTAAAPMPSSASATSSAPATATSSPRTRASSAGLDVPAVLTMRCLNAASIEITGSEEVRAQADGVHIQAPKGTTYVVKVHTDTSETVYNETGPAVLPIAPQSAAGKGAQVMVGCTANPDVEMGITVTDPRGYYQSGSITSGSCPDAANNSLSNVVEGRGTTPQGALADYAKKVSGGSAWSFRRMPIGYPKGSDQKWKVIAADGSDYAIATVTSQDGTWHAWLDAHCHM